MSSGPYDDIINLPHHVSCTRPQMPRENRAAQFAPFAALTGYDAAISETARITDTRVELDENAIELLDMKLRLLADGIDEQPEIAVTYFRPDEKKKGGAYITASGALKKIDDYEHEIIFMDGKKIHIKNIIEIESELFKVIE